MVTSILAAVFVLGLLVTVHELGHFLAAKRLGVGVIRFSIGFGPVLFSRTVAGTEYALSAIPLGGYVKMVGEAEDGLQGGEESVDNDEKPPLVAEVRDDSFADKPAWVKATILLAGPGFNLLFAWLLYTILFATGVPVLGSVVGDVKEGMPAAAAGLVSGDRILAVDGAPVSRWDELSAAIRASEGRLVEIKVQSEGSDAAERLLRIQPEAMEGKTIFGEPLPTWVIGIGPADQVITERSGIVASIGKGFVQTGEFVKLTLVSFVKLFQRVVPASSLGGPIMIMQLAGEQAQQGAQALIGFMAILSINLGIINLLPIPVLDGGQLMFLGIEAVLRRPLGERSRELATQIGFFLLISLMGFAFYNDISRLIFS
jgi:regulator of sigma E protease